MQRIVTICCLILTLLSALLSAQTTDPATQQLQSEKDRAQLLADIAKAKQQQAESDAATFKAQLGSINTANLPQGTIKTDSVVIEANILAYLAARDSAKVITDRIGCPSVILFYSGKDLDALQALATLIKQTDQIGVDSIDLFKPVKLRQVAASVLPDPTGTDLKDLYVFQPANVAQFVPAAAFATIDAALSVISLFKTDTEIKGVASPVDDLALQALVADQLKTTCKPSIKIIHPAYFSAPLESGLLQKLQNLATSSANATLKAQDLDSFVRTPLMKAIDAAKKRGDDLDKLKKQREALQKALEATKDPAKRAQLEKELKDTDAAMAAMTKQQADEMQVAGANSLEKLIGVYLSNQLRVEDRIASLKAFTAKLSDLNTALAKTDASGVTQLQILLKAESLAKAKGDTASVLVTKFVSLGGNNETKKNAFKSNLSFTGGSIAEFLLIDPSGVLQQSGVVECYGGRIAEDDLTKRFGTRQPAVCQFGPIQ